MEHDQGFSLVEVMLAMSLTLAVTATVFSVMNMADGSFTTQSEMTDMQQRLRVAVDTLYKDLVMAGAGPYAGSQTGSLIYYVAPVLPSRHGAVNDDPAATVRSDTITLIYVPSTSSQTTISQAVSGTSPELKVNGASSCPPGETLCGFTTGMTVAVFNASGEIGLFTIVEVQDSAGRLRINRADNDTTFREGAKIAQASSHTYYLKKATSQLMHYDGTTSPDVPVVDHVVGLGFEYYADPQPPQLTGRALDDPTGPWTTYGPAPPSLAARIPSQGYPEGENCLFAVSGDAQVPRLPVLASTGRATTLVKLTEAQLTDGPWCPDATSVNRFDADLYRIRKIVVTIRVESANAALRGPTSVLFTNGGTSSSGQRWLPDQPVTFEVAPRNLNLSR